MVRNVHERLLNAPASTAGELIDRLGSRDDALWPRDRWPAMKFDGPLAEGATGGHGPIRYFVEAYEPGRSVRFRFTGPKGFNGFHAFELEDAGLDRSRSRHVLEMRTAGAARITWPLVFRPLHDALIEDAFDRAEAHVGQPPARPNRWSWWVKALRAAMTRGRRGGDA